MTSVFSTYLSGPQLGVGLALTSPLPVGFTVAVRLKQVGWSKWAVTALSPSIVTGVGFAVPVAAPVQFAERQESAGRAVSCTWVPAAYLAAPQLGAGEAAIVPLGFGIDVGDQGVDGRCLESGGHGLVVVHRDSRGTGAPAGIPAPVGQGITLSRDCGQLDLGAGGARPPRQLGPGSAFTEPPPTGVALESRR